MQTIYIDMATHRIIAMVRAMQNDVGRRLAVVLTDNSAAYAIPADAVFSVWYSGASGEGNYTTIDGRSAFSVSGNTVTVELITQMLQNKGPGQLCLVMNKADGTQLGLWNIPYFVEEIPGAGSKEATAYYTAFQEAVLNIKSADIESTEYPGCFYRMCGTEKSWINPPMVSGVEYRTTEYFDQYPVWTRLDSHYVGTEYQEVKSLGISSYDTKLLAIRCISRRLSGIWEPDTSYALYPGDPLTIRLVSAGADPASEPGYHRTQIWYTKNDDTPTGGFG